MRDISYVQRGVPGGSRGIRTSAEPVDLRVWESSGTWPLGEPLILLLFDSQSIDAGLQKRLDIGGP